MVPTPPKATGGVDLASQAKYTGVCVITWSESRATVTEMSDHADDECIAQLMGRVEKLGIDIPLGWPMAFVDAVSMHASDGSWPADYDHAQAHAFRYRKTDLWIRETLNARLPLSVSSDLIAIPAMRAAALLARQDAPVVRDGSGIVAEVYPAAALRRWGFRSQQYKGTLHAEARRELVLHLRRETKHWFEFADDFVEICCMNDNAWDALIAALVARAVSVGLVEPIPSEYAAAARQEGWIALPTVNSLHQLAFHEP